ncbi:hypothetical protein BJ166DRAFT_91024 [Pestalotiopsis sp. NC0098]|nr:hypothetical protein BJ166DRAFT_91024 [Pestalotiopsis sp. NC0098]
MAEYTRFVIDDISFNSKCIPFSEWMGLLTVCLAPLIVHIASGATSVSCLAPERARWYDYVCHYNPTSILWRYVAITDRRIRALYWTNSEMAATNAIFWTPAGWDGREHMVTTAAPYCCHLPEHPHADLVSVTMIKTVIATAQGFAAFWPLVGHLVNIENSNSYVSSFGVDSIFTPVAVFGMMRLFAARWLTEDYIYTMRSDIPMKALRAVDSDSGSTQHLMSPQPVPSFEVIQRFRSTSYWPSRVFRTGYFLLLLLFWAVCALYVIPLSAISAYGRYMTTTMFFVAIYYLVFLTITVALFAYYFIRGKTTTTIIPCMSSPFYRTYTYCFFLGSLALMIIASIETNRNPAGGYTSENWDGHANSACSSEIYFVGIKNAILSAVTSTQPPLADGSVPSVTTNSSNATYYMYDFAGYCSGKLV